MLRELQKELVRIFGERVAFHRIERMLYSCDLEVLPGLIANQIQTLPDAVVQPNSPDELIALIELAVRYRIPLVPRGTGTAGYGGAVPTKRGIVVDFYRMNRIYDVNGEAKTVTVDPGVVWNELDAELHNHDLALRLYPGSGISSTVAGWVANGGGVGIGSFEYGYFKDNIVEVEIITPKGVKKLSGDELALVYGMAGVTGFISGLTLWLKGYDDSVPIVGAFPTPDGLLGAFQEVEKDGLALWHISYRSPLHVRLTEQAIEEQLKQFPTAASSEKPRLPENKFIATFVYPRSRKVQVESRLLNIIKTYGGEALDYGAVSEWKERFYPVRLKALGPSLIPSEVVIPTHQTSTFIEKVQTELEGEVALHGTLANGGRESLIMVYILDDERRRGYPLTYSKRLLPIEIAKKLGGRVYSIGMYFTDEAESYFSRAKLLKSYQFKKETDPEGIMNPGKVFPPSLDKGSPIKKLNLLIRLGKKTQGLVARIDKLLGGRPLGKSVSTKTLLGKQALSKEIAWDSVACARCGYCRTQCRLFGALGWESASPRGIFRFLRESLKGKLEMDERIADMISLCTMCGGCDSICQINAPIMELSTLVLRPAIWQDGYDALKVYQIAAHNALISHNPMGLSHEARTQWLPPGGKYKETGQIGFFAGCASSYVMPDLGADPLRILNAAGIEPVYLGSDEWCCGSPALLLGATEEALETVSHNIEEFNKRGIKTIITPCPGCWVTLAHFYPVFANMLNLEYDIEVKHITQVLSELMKEGKIRFDKPLNLKVTWHDPCHIGRCGGIYEPPREVLASIPGVELVEMPRNRDNSLCCGRQDVRLRRIGNMVNDRILEAEQTGASVLVSSCPTCEINFGVGVDNVRSRIKVRDLSRLVAQGMGIAVEEAKEKPTEVERKALEEEIGGLKDVLPAY